MRNRVWFSTGCLLLVATAGIAGSAEPSAPATTVFARGRWDSSAWTPLRLPAQPQARPLVQKEDSIGTNGFSEAEKKQGLDNVLMMTDTHLTEGEFSVEFRIGEDHAAPGFFLSPVCEGDALVRGIAVFVADYTMAVWQVDTETESRKTTYAHLVRLARWQEPGKRHTFRCRFSRRRKSIALQVDDSDVVVLRLPEVEINSRIGLWGCHGRCDYYRLTVTASPTLKWSGAAPGS